MSDDVRAASGHRVFFKGKAHVWTGAGIPVRACGGFTLIELIVVLSIVAILMVAMGFEFVGWRDKFSAESDIKTMYATLSNARAQAIQTKSVHFVNIPEAEAYNYYVFIDNSPYPDGNGELDTSADGVFMDETLSFIIAAQDRHFGFTKSGLIFTDSGILQSPRWIRISSPEGEVLNSDYDCLELVSTRINLGLFDDGTSECVGK